MSELDANGSAPPSGNSAATGGVPSDSGTTPVAAGGQGAYGPSSVDAGHSEPDGGAGGYRFNMSTTNVDFTATDLTITIDGQPYSINFNDLTLNSNPPSTTYTTFEAMWIDQGRPMRLYIYFNADQTHWWSNEIRTYNGQPQGDWLFYYGDFFECPLGTPYVGDLTLQNIGSGDAYHGTITIRNLRLLPQFAR